jgi:hypothetical protein
MLYMTVLILCFRNFQWATMAAIIGKLTDLYKEYAIGKAGMC